jgi:hypothetical protein
MVAMSLAEGWRTPQHPIKAKIPAEALILWVSDR